jgi:hypothetical protein
MVDLEVRLIFLVLVWLRFAEVLRLLLVVFVQLGQERLVRSLGEHTLLLKDGENAHWLLNTNNMKQIKNE